MKRLVALVLVLAVVLVGAGVLGLSALRSGDDGQAEEQLAAPDPTPIESETGDAEEPGDPVLADFYSQTLEWETCEDGHECATLEVPLDYADPAGDTIELALLRVPARGQALSSMVVNPGGPGAPGTDYAAAAGRVFREPLRRHFDIVGFDPRGTGESAPVDCLTDGELDEFIAGDPDPDDAAEAASYRQDVLSFGRGCRERSGELVSHVSTVEAARDMDVLRAALGDPALTYFGASYGTKLGATYAELFPERVGRFVLDGAVDVTLDNRELGLEQAAGFETALRAYIENCLETDDCFLGDSVEEGLDTITGLLADIDADPLPTSSGRELRIGNAFYGLVLPLYARDYWFLLSAALREALGGKGDALLELADLYTSRGAGGYNDNSMEAIYAINCLDDPSSVPFGKVEQQYADFEEASPTFGRVFAWSLTGCRGFGGPAGDELEIRAEGAAPILVVGTTRDPATPLRWAEALAEQLESGVLLRRDGDGHTGYNSGNACVDETIEAYLIAGTVPDDPTDC
ncbi:alpha/beta hydrolase [Nocardioides gansuensis]|uniref:Alpha/beta hydrolase n=1 Tax=Nocardioides gansuensis TaxID=2138300 RepID=A0A2T8F9M8_9ACTN|nr:alpha/beta hydrolase [Nocardioides gansuensis]PVG82438.1 alpha/beta hydrolase [Nocardioides gansuensis]